MKITSVDNHGVKEFKSWFLLVCVLAAIATTVTTSGYLLYVLESGANNSNVTTIKDATWVITMMMTTVGFGDFYPVTVGGRAVCWIAFAVGAVEIGMLIRVISSYAGSDTSIQNRELRTQLSEVMRKLEHMESHLKMDTSITSDSHNLDYVLVQQEYSSDLLRDGFLTAGLDSSGMYMLSVEAIHRSTGKEYKRWIPADNENQLMSMFNRYLGNSDEL